MDPDFWHARWGAGRIGFHQTSVHEQLKYHAPRLARLDGTPRVLVPLCGKSLDMRYLRSLGYPVVGVELSALAARDFFVEAGQTPSIRELSPGLACHELDGIAILCGDIFDVTGEHLGPVHAAYDRAALVALPQETRTRYANLLGSLLPSGAPLLLITCDYPQHQMSGPPFSVPPAEVDELFEETFTIKLVADEDLLRHAGENGRPVFKGRVSRAREQTYLLTRR